MLKKLLRKIVTYEHLHNEYLNKEDKELDLEMIDKIKIDYIGRIHNEEEYKKESIYLKHRIKSSSFSNSLILQIVLILVAYHIGYSGNEFFEITKMVTYTDKLFMNVIIYTFVSIISGVFLLVILSPLIYPVFYNKRQNYYELCLVVLETYREEIISCEINNRFHDNNSYTV